MAVSSLEQISALQLEADYAQKTDDIIMAIMLNEKILVLQAKEFGIKSKAVEHTRHGLAELCNLQSLKDLSAGKYDDCLELLNKALILSENQPFVTAVTYNNFSCYYKRLKKFKMALSYVEKSIQIEHTIVSKAPKYYKISDSYLNQCVIYSDLKKHDKALNSALLALSFLAKEFDVSENTPNYLFDPNLIADLYTSNARPPPLHDRLYVFIIAYTNYATQLDHLGDKTCVSYYELAFQLAQILNKLNPGYSANSFRSSLEKSRKKWRCETNKK